MSQGIIVKVKIDEVKVTMKDPEKNFLKDLDT